MADLANQQTAIPTRKVTGAAGGGVTAALLIWAAGKFLGVDVGPEDAALITTAVAVTVGYFMRERVVTRPL